MNKKTGICTALVAGAVVVAGDNAADEGLFGYVKGAAPLPKGAWDAEQWVRTASTGSRLAGRHRVAAR